MKTKMNGDSEEITIISYGVKVEGKVSSNGSIRLDGTIQGDIVCQGNVTIGESGEVFGKVNDQRHHNRWQGRRYDQCKRKTNAESKADLKGDIYTKILVVEAGARFDGKSNMGQSSSSGSSDSPSTNPQ